MKKNEDFHSILVLWDIHVQASLWYISTAQGFPAGADGEQLEKMRSHYHTFEPVLFVRTQICNFPAPWQRSVNVRTCWTIAAGNLVPSPLVSLGHVYCLLHALFRRLIPPNLMEFFQLVETHRKWKRTAVGDICFNKTLRIGSEGKSCSRMMGDHFCLLAHSLCFVLFVGCRLFSINHPHRLWQLTTPPQARVWSHSVKRQSFLPTAEQH